MPVEPEVEDQQEDIEVTLPTAASIPLREGEERFAGSLGMQDQFIKESIVAELRKQMKQMGDTSDGQRVKLSASPSARRRQLDVKKKVDELKKLTFKRADRWEGPCCPFTVVNLNPCPLTLAGELQRWTIPAAGKGNIAWVARRGRKFIGSYMTIETPHIYGSHTGTVNDKQTGTDMPSVAYNYLPPAGLAHQFYDHFVEGATDAQGMGGLLIFEGDIHTLDPKRLDRNEGKIYIPKKEITLEGYGDVVYVVEEVRLVDFLDRMLLMQANYASAQINEGHGYANSNADEQRNQLSNYHRIWHNFALEHAYIEQALPWATERLKDSPKIQAVYCPDCRTKQADPTQYFCRECNAPFDAFKAFMDGKQVSPDRLAVYDEESEEWKAIVKETLRRKAKIAMLELPAAPGKKERKRDANGHFLPDDQQ